MGSQAKRMLGKVVDCAGKAGLAEQETKDLKLAVNYCRCCHSGRNSHSHTRDFVGKWARAEQVSQIFPSLTPPPQTMPQHSKEGYPTLVNI